VFPFRAKDFSQAIPCLEELPRLILACSARLPEQAQAFRKKRKKRSFDRGRMLAWLKRWRRGEGK